MHFGAALRLLRLDAGMTMRDLAGRIGVSSAYLSRVENGHDPPPTPHRLVAIADALGLPRAALVELARQAGPAVSGYLQRVPAAGALFLEIARLGLTEVQIARVKSFVDKEFPSVEGRRPGRRLSDLLTPERVVLGFSGAGMEDVVAVAATRLPISRGLDRRRIVSRILEREREASSCLGDGFTAPHAVIEGCTNAAVLMTMATPVAMDTPDGLPVRVAVVVMSSAFGPRHLEMLARVARLGSYGVADELCDARTPEQARSIVERIESLW